MNRFDDTTAIVLAGGKGSRMNYREKAWVMHQNKPLIMHVIDLLAPQVSDILVSRNRLDARYDALPYQCIGDANENYDGPLAGVSACLGQVSTMFTLVVPCDTPNLPTDLVNKLRSALNEADICIAKDEERDQPLILLGRTERLRSIAGYLSDGGRSVHGWLEQQKTTRVLFPGPHLSNINEISQLG